METVWSAVAAGVGVAALLGTIVAFLMKLSVRFGKLEQRVDTGEARAQEDRIHDRSDFGDLFAFQKATTQTMATLVANMTTLTATVNQINSKLDAMQERSHGNN